MTATYPGCDGTHDPQLRSWVQDANGHADFPIQNLPFGVFSTLDAEPQPGVAIGDHILSIKALVQACLLEGDALAAAHAAMQGPALNALLALGAPHRKAFRAAVSRLLAEGSPPRPELLHLAADCTTHLPACVGDYTDFYAGIHHALNVGRLFRPDDPLLPNYKWVPIGYHGRSSSLRPSGAPVRRPLGQRKLPDEASPTFGPARSVDFELELGIWVGPGNELGEPIPIDAAARSIAGFCLLNDWSARDIQAWEYQPLGPFLAKSFHTTVSPWIITPEALAPFRRPQPPRTAGDPGPLPYLLSQADQSGGALNVALEVSLLTAAMRRSGVAPQRITASHAGHLYWTPAQLVTHHASNGCDLHPGDLLGTGTISSPEPAGRGSLLEITRSGREPLTLASGEQRRFLEDGDEVSLRARASRKGFVSIGFGECRAVVTPADPSRTRLSRATTAAAAIEDAAEQFAAIVTPLPREVLLWRPAPEVWSILDNLAHIEEFVPFWIGEVREMLARPPRPWGRDQGHAGRLAAVRDTSARDLAELLGNIRTASASAAAYLRSLDDAQFDTEAMSRNPRWATKPVSFVVDTLLVKHLSDHRGQIQRNLRQHRESTTAPQE